jgi:hypothetical protein
MSAAYIAAGIAAALIGYAGSYVLVHRARARRIRERIEQ